jgi:hypothetical protein
MRDQFHITKIAVNAVYAMSSRDATTLSSNKTIICTLPSTGLGVICNIKLQNSRNK